MHTYLHRAPHELLIHFIIEIVHGDTGAHDTVSGTDQRIAAVQAFIGTIGGLTGASAHVLVQARVQGTFHMTIHVVIAPGRHQGIIGTIVAVTGRVHLF